MDSEAGEDIAASVTELQDVLLGTESIEKFVQELVVQAARLVADSLSCAITLNQVGRMSTMGCSDELATRVNDLQYELGEGPCLAALREGVPVRVDDTADEPRWPRFGKQAAACGVRAALSLPLRAQDETIGALNLYAVDRGAFEEEETRRAENFAENAAGALALGLRLVSYAALTAQLRESLSSRAVIDQAVGVILAQERCGQDKAFSILRTASQNRNVKLRQVAREIVLGVTGEAPQPPPFRR
ncbi:MAG TPA: GAF and ANTAR domain-containing protein [Streptosporangiaceae bacterium]|jgi:GAF domain-containing protein